jgi:hypothetical protein
MDNGLTSRRKSQIVLREVVSDILGRMGQEFPVMITYLLSRNALDSRMGKVLKGKLDEQMAFFTAGEFASLL